ncbi:MAG: 3'-5' exonuclease [Bacteroidales bacterium]|nr:3'-5' exonuclease [Bacteroidales bacterium]HPY81954.1 3'-5' exonuclease [Bacteroidales bacterium]
MKSFIAIDFETANYKRTSICSVGMVFVENKQIINKHYAVIKPKPNFYIPEFIKIHGITYWDTLHADTFDVFWNTIFPKIGNLPFVAHNKSFDFACLKATLAEYNLPEFKNEFLCSLQQSRRVLPHLENHKLPTVSKHLGYDLQNHHNAIADAEACAHIAIKIF